MTTPLISEILRKSITHDETAMQFYNGFLDYINATHPTLIADSQAHLPGPNLFSPHSIQVERTHLQAIERFVELTHRATRSNSDDTRFFDSLSSPLPAIARRPIPYESAFMSYDFHITATGPKIIEVNTNASMLAWSSLLTAYQMKTDANVYFSEIRKMLEEEYRAIFSSGSPSVVITDEAPQSQKAYSEFLLYRALFRSWGWSAEIEDRKELKFESSTQKLVNNQGQSFGLVYNRTTDFYFAESESSALREAYESQKVVVTPNPSEYGRLSDKSRLVDFGNQNWLGARGLTAAEVREVLAVVPRIQTISKFSVETPKQERKKWFFKPRSSFGGRAVYRGASISNRIFDEILSKDYLAQEYIEPGSLKLSADELSQVHIAPNSPDFKYDLRAYTYRNRVLLLAGRIFQGQVTNTNTPGGGMAAVQIV